MSDAFNPIESLTGGDKILLGLTEDVEDEFFTCLVKKIKNNLVAIVVSNRDKQRLDIDSVDIFYMFSEWDGETWITPMRVAQRHSFPLLILSQAGEPERLSRPENMTPPAPPEELESIDSDHMAETPGEKAFPGSWGEIAAVAAVDETPENRFEADDAGETPSQDELTEEEILSAPESLEATEALSAMEDSLTGLPDIDTSELDAELDTDIEKVIVKSEEEPEEDEDDLSDMVIVKDKSIWLGGSADADAPYVSGDIESGEMDLFADTSIETPDTPAYKYPSRESRTPDEAGVAEERFYDFFGLTVFPLDDDTADEMTAIVRLGQDPFKSFAAEGAGDEEIIPNGLDDKTRKAIENVLGKVTRLEETLLELQENPPARPAAMPEKIGAICLELGDGGMRVVMDRPVEAGRRVLVSVDRPWKPALRFDAVAVVGSSDENSGLTVSDLRFSSISADGAGAISNYLDHGAEHFELLKRVSRD